jgi:imidazolonepropionase-like amidohydrolase
MCKVFRSFITITVIVFTLASCSVRDKQGRTLRISEREGRVTAFINVTLVPMTTEKVIENQTVLVKGTRIIAIGPSNSVGIPEDAIIINGAGAYVMPGLADMHMHTRDNWFTNAWPIPPTHLYLANGVTTIRCFGPGERSPRYILRWRNEIKQGKRIGPTIYTCGPILYGPVDDPQRIVREQKAQGFDFMKPYSFLSKEEFHEAISTAKHIGMYTAGHIPFAVGLDGVLSEGMDEIAHIEELDFEFLDFDRTKELGRREWFRYILGTAVQLFGSSADLDIEDLENRLGKKTSATIDKLKAANIPVCTTLVVGEVIVKKLHETEAFLARPENEYLPNWYMDAFHQGKEKHQVQFRGAKDFAIVKYTLEKMLLTKLKQAGIPLLLSTDAGTGGMGIVPGFSIHDELRILTENGFTPYEAIASGTVKASKVVEAMTGKDDFGTLEVGKRADILVVNGNPLEDVTNIKDLRGVMAAGRWYDKAELQKMIIPRIPILGAIHHVHESDNRLNTHIEIIIGKNYTGNLPDDIDSISITGPSGDLPVGKDDFVYLPHFRDFWISIPGSPEIGTYTFRVTSGTRSGSATDIQSMVRAIPIPDVSTVSPNEGARLRSTTPTFSWGPVEAGIPVYYRLEIYKQPGGRVYSTERIKDMLSHTIPDEILRPGQAYRWRIRVTDSKSWINTENRSHSGWRSFTIE